MASTFRGRSAAVVAAAPAEVVPAAPMDSRGEMMRLDMDMATSLAKSELVPRDYRGKPENILVAMGLGRALGIDPIPSLYALHVIEGTPSPSAKTQQALVRRAGHKFRVLEATSQVATVEIERCDDPGHPVRVSYSIEDASIGGLLDRWVERWVRVDGGRNRKEVWTLPHDAPMTTTVADDLPGAPPWAKSKQISRRDNWWKVPRDMLMARATTTCVGQACAEVLSGIDFDTAWQAESYDVATIADVTVTDPVAEASQGVGDNDAIREGGGDDGPVSGGDASADYSADAGDGVDSHDVDRSEPEPPPEITDAEVIEAPPAVDPGPPPAVPEVDPGPEMPDAELLAEGKAAVATVRKAGRNKALVESLNEAGIPVSSQKWTAEQAREVIRIAGEIE